MSLRKQFVRYLKAVEFIAPEVCNLHRGEALFQIRYVLVFVSALLKDGEKQDFQTGILQRHNFGSISHTFIL